MGAGQVQGGGEAAVDGGGGGFEAEDQHGGAVACGSGQQRLTGVQEAAVGRGEVRLRDGPYGVQAAVEGGEGHGRLARHAGHRLWSGGAHPVLLRSGDSLLHADLYRATLAHWQSLLTTAEQELGPEHHGTLYALATVAAAHQHLGRYGDAVRLHNKATATYTRLLGDDHPAAHQARGNLATAYRAAGRYADALRLHEQVLAARIRLLCDDHPDTHRARANLAAIYRNLGRKHDAVALEGGGTR